MKISALLYWYVFLILYSSTPPMVFTRLLNAAPVASSKPWALESQSIVFQERSVCLVYMELQRQLRTVRGYLSNWRNILVGQLAASMKLKCTLFQLLQLLIGPLHIKLKHRIHWWSSYQRQNVWRSSLCYLTKQSIINTMQASALP